MNKLTIGILSLLGVGVIGGSAYCLAHESYNTGKHDAEIKFTQNENKQDQSLEEAVVAISQELPGGAPVITDIDDNRKLISISGDMAGIGGITNYRVYNYLYNSKTKSYEVIKYLDNLDNYVNLTYFYTCNGVLYFNGQTPYLDDENVVLYKQALYSYSNGAIKKDIDLDTSVTNSYANRIVNGSRMLLQSTGPLSIIDFEEKSYTVFQNDKLEYSLTKSNGKTYSFLENVVYFINRNSDTNKLELAKIDLTTKEKTTVVTICNLDGLLTTDLYDSQNKFYMRDTDIFMQEEGVGVIHLDLLTGEKTTLIEDTSNVTSFCIFNFPILAESGARKMKYDTGLTKDTTYLYLAKTDENTFKMYTFDSTAKSLSELFMNEQGNKTITVLESSKGIYFIGGQVIWYQDKTTNAVTTFDRTSTTDMTASSYGFNCYGAGETENGMIFVMSKSVLYHDYTTDTWAHTINCNTVSTYTKQSELDYTQNELNVTKTNAFSMSGCFAKTTKVSSDLYFVHGITSNFFVKITPATDDTSLSIYAYTFETSAKSKAEVVDVNSNGILYKNDTSYRFYAYQGAKNTNTIVETLWISQYGEFKSIVQSGTNYILTTQNGTEYIFNTTTLSIYCRKLVLG